MTDLSDSRVFVTGHTGFTGTWLSLCLSRSGASFAGYSRPPPTRPSLFDLVWPKGSRRPFKDLRGDILDFSRLRKHLTAFRPDIVIHLAAQSLVREGFKDPIGTFQSNLMGTVNLLQAVRTSRHVKAVLVVTSDKCYMNDGSGRRFSELDPLGGDDPYSSSKACAELASTAFYRSYLKERSVDLATARAGNILGGGDWSKDRIVPDIIRSLVGGRAVPVRNPSAIRPWQYVLDAVGGYLHLASKLLNDPGAHPGAWNFAAHFAEGHTVEDLVRTSVHLWGEGEYRVEKPSNRFREAPALFLDPGKAARELGWKARCDFAETLRRTISWYRGYYRNRSSPSDLCALELADFGL